jgi:hypothetical protein
VASETRLSVISTGSLPLIKYRRGMYILPREAEDILWVKTAHLGTTCMLHMRLVATLKAGWPASKGGRITTHPPKWNPACYMHNSSGNRRALTLAHATCIFHSYLHACTCSTHVSCKLKMRGFGTFPMNATRTCMLHDVHVQQEVKQSVCRHTKSPHLDI